MVNTTKKSQREIIPCPDCNSKNTTKWGFSPNRHGKKQRYVCFDCGHTFYKENNE
jgi:transposase-like protein